LIERHYVLYRREKAEKCNSKNNNNHPVWESQKGIINENKREKENIKMKEIENNREEKIIIHH